MKKVLFLLALLLPLLSSAARWYVDASNNNLIRNGNSWNTAVRHIGYLRNDLQNGDEVWIAQGSYGIQEEFVFLIGTYYHRPLETFSKDVTVYGGFQGNESSLNQRNPSLYPTVIQPEGSFSMEWHKDATFDGFTFSGVWDPFSSDEEWFNIDEFIGPVAVMFRNCKFEDLELNSRLFMSDSVDDEDPEFILEDCVFNNVSAARLNTTLTNDVEFNRCTFQSCNGVVLTESFFWGMHLIQCSISDSYFGLFSQHSLFENCLLENNTFVTSSNSLVYFSEFRNCTVANNTLNKKFFACTFANSIVYDNELIGIATALDYSCEVFYSIIEDDMNFSSEISVSHLDPGFQNAANGNYQLEACSKAINRGIGIGYQADDLAGNTRFVDGAVDIGCYEYQGNFPDRIYVDLNASGNGSGSSWSDAMTSLQDALSMACPRTEVWVKEGNYTPGPIFPVDRNSTFLVPGGVKLYGGFSGTESNTSQRDYENNITLLSGGIGVLGNGDNCYTVVTLGQDEELLVLDGFAIGYGNANGIVDNSRGGAMNASFPNALVRNCYIGFNNGISGGAVYTAGSGSLDFDNCTFASNSSSANGGAFHSGSIANLSPLVNIERCTFQNNTAVNGGALYLTGITTIRNSVMDDNSASGQGNAIFNNPSSTLNLYNSTLVDNNPVAVQNQGSSLVISNIFKGNGADITSGSQVKQYNLSDATLHSGFGNLQGDPSFVNEAAGNFRLNNSSIAREAGNFPSGTPSTDRDGNPRLIGASIDMGAYENQAGCVNPHDVCLTAYDYDLVADYGMAMSLDCSASYDNLTTNCDEPLGTVWIRFELPITGAQVIVNPSVGGSNADVQLDLYTGNCESLSYDSCVNNTGAGAAETLTLDGSYSGTTLYMRISSLNGEMGDVAIFGFELPCNLLPTIAVGNTGACYSGPDGISVFDQEITVTYSGEPYGGFLVIERPLGQDDFFTLTGSPQTIVLTGLPASGDNVSIAGKFVASGYEGCYTQWTNAIPAPCCQPDNDECAFAYAMGINENVVGSTRCATFNNWIPSSCILYAGRDLWYTFTAPSPSVQIDMNILELFDGDVNPRITVFSGTCNSLVEVACGNDNFEGFDESHVFSGLTPGEVYYLRADVFSEQQAIFSLRVASVEPSPCLGDFNGDGLRNVGDLTQLLSDFSCTSNCTADITGDGATNTGDLTAFLSVFGQNCD